MTVSSEIKTCTKIRLTSVHQHLFIASLITHKKRSYHRMSY